MRRFNQFPHGGVGTEVFLDSIKVLWVVTMKSGAGFFFLQFDLVETIVVVIPGGQPNRSDAELFQVRQAIDDAMKIAAVIVKLVLPIVEATRLCRIVV